MRTLILASSSPRRKELLTNLGLSFCVVPSEIAERLNPRLAPRSQAEALSSQKAAAVYEKHRGQDVVILGADTIVVQDKRTFGKPESLVAAKNMLSLLNGKQHTVITGFTLIDCISGRVVSKASETKVWMKKMTIHEITSYLQKEQVLDKAGSYAMQNLGAILFEKIEGDYFTVAGLPLFLLAKELERFGIKLL
jgi:septum formation protein